MLGPQLNPGNRETFEFSIHLSQTHKEAEAVVAARR